MSCSLIPHPTDDRPRFSLMSAGLGMWNSREHAADAREAHAGLAQFCRNELLPHLEHEEDWLDNAGRCPEGRLLADAMRAQLRTMKAIAVALAETTDDCDAVAQVRVLHHFLAAHDHHQKLLSAANPVA